MTNTNNEVYIVTSDDEIMQEVITIGIAADLETATKMCEKQVESIKKYNKGEEFKKIQSEDGLVYSGTSFYVVATPYLVRTIDMV